MHLSIFSDAFIAIPKPEALGPGRWQAHRDGVVRGLAVIAIASLLLGLVALGDGAATHRTTTQTAAGGARTERTESLSVVEKADGLYRSSSTAATIEPIKTTLERL